jgi:hypothetical protein
MSAESIVYGLLSPLASGRAFPDVAPHGAPLPYIVFQQVGGSADVYVESVLLDRENGRFQVSCWATTREQANALARQAEAALVASPAMQCEPLGARSSVVDGTGDPFVYGTRQDFSIWSDR